MKKLLLCLCLIAVPLAAQDAKWPEGWKVRFDQADADPSKLMFMTMTPGWHIITGPAAIFYRPDMTGRGNFRLEAEMHLFDPKGRDREGFGIFIGGRDLEGDGQAYTYFLIRNDRNFLVKRRAGADTPVIQNWTPSDAIVPYKTGESSVKNVLAVEVGPTTADFSINGQKAASVPREQIDADGIVGLRVNHAINVHVSKLDLTAR